MVPSADPNPGPDLELATRALRGEPEATDALVARLRCIARFVYVCNRRRGGLLRVPDLADVGQTIATDVWRRLPEFRGHSTLETWVYRFCALHVSKAIAKQTRRNRIESAEEENQLAQLQGPAPHSALEYDELQLVLDELGPPGADVIRLRHFEERAFDSIAEGMGVPTETAKSWYYRGLAELRRKLSIRTRRSLS